MVRVGLVADALGDRYGVEAIALLQGDAMSTGLLLMLCAEGASTTFS